MSPVKIPLGQAKLWTPPQNRDYNILVRTFDKRLEHQGTRIVDSQVFSFLSEIALANRVLLGFVFSMKYLLHCDSSRNLAPPFYSTYDYGIPGDEYVSLARIVAYNAFAEKRQNVAETSSESFYTTSINKSWPVLEIDSYDTNGNVHWRGSNAEDWSALHVSAYTRARDVHVITQPACIKCR